MSFSNPLGFIALAAIPVLIIIYIIKSKYTEQTIASTYLWELSERFLKRKNPLKSITGLISLILQILAVIFIALAIARPVFVLKGKANDYCFILDASASMNVSFEGGKTRFEEGKEQIEEIIDSSVEGSTYTLIVAGDTAETVFSSSDDKSSALSQLKNVSCSFVEANLNTALVQAQKYFNSNRSLDVYVVTDKEFEKTDNVTYIGVNSEAANYGISNVKYVSGTDTVTVTGTLYSYSGDASLNVQVFLDGSETPACSTPVSVTKDVAQDFSIIVGSSVSSSIRVAIEESDSLSYDNEVKMYTSTSEDEYSVLLVSKTPFLIQAALKSVENITIECEVISPSEYSAAKGTGYDLYVFDSDDDDPFTPDELPSDGAVWFINPSASVAKSGFSVRGTADWGNAATLSESSSSIIKTLLKGTWANSDTSVASYVRCGLNRTFYPLMYCDGDPVVFAGSNEWGNREVVFAFDFNFSDFVPSFNGFVIIKNLINYTFPTMLDDTESYYSGDTITLNVLADCNSLSIITPSGEEEYLDTTETICEYQLTEVGEYKVVATVNNSRRTATLFSQFPESERILNVKEDNFVISGEASTEKRDGRYDDIMYLFIILAVLMVADWAVYCYEQYQLR